MFMFVYHSNDAQALATRPAIDSAWQCVKFVGMVAILGWLWIGADARQLTAGCDHPAGAINSQSGFQSAGYARNFQFLGRWIYEGGEVKYVPWEGSRPCQGPNCQADDVPGTDLAANTSLTVRSLPIACPAALRPPGRQPRSIDWLIVLHGVPLSGFPSGFEYPP